jgi:hypothetical protein
MDVQQYTVTKAAVDDERPKGLWADAPALAATTVAMENTSGYDVVVNVTGGTTTAVKRNGVTITGLTSSIGEIFLGPGSTIAITYSAAPTLQWAYA